MIKLHHIIARNVKLDFDRLETLEYFKKEIAQFFNCKTENINFTFEIIPDESESELK